MTKGPIIYVDDEKENLESFRWAMAKEFDISTSLSCMEALKQMEINKFKVMVTDERMPHMSGLDLIREVNSKYPDMICILLTAYADVNVTVKAINQGAIYKFILKPWDSNELRSSLENAVETYDLRMHNKILLKGLKEKNEELETKINELNKATDDLYKSEEKFRNIFNNNNNGIAVLNMDHKILSVNDAIINSTGYAEEELLHEEIYGYVQHEYIDLLKNRLSLLRKGKPVTIAEIAIISKSKRIIPVEINSKVIVYENEKAILSVIRDITERKQIRKRIFTAMLQAEENERQRIARDLHDGIGPLLSTSNIYINAMATTQDPNRKKDAMDRLAETINEAIKTVQEISNNISPHILKNFGLKTAINSFYAKLKLIKGLHFKVNSNFEERLDHNIEVTLYRVIIELINNSLKYGDPSAITIGLIKKNNLLIFSYSENGKGFDLEKQRKNKQSMGLSNIYSRIESVNGFIEMKSKPGKGVQVMAEVPLI